MALCTARSLLRFGHSQEHGQCDGEPEQPGPPDEPFVPAIESPAADNKPTIDADTTASRRRNREPACPATR